MVVGRVAGIRIFPVLQPAKTRTVETVRVVVSPVMLYVNRILTLRPLIALLQLQRVSVAPYLAITVGVKRMKLLL